jgi:hypothetical protein
MNQMLAPESTPKADCDCLACRSMRRAADRRLGYRTDGSLELDADLETNYQRYLGGELVSRDDRD